ncbi:hypothetical protein MNBD_BACTEROID03-195 [hydrothermal vent metagenome]|uniref:Acyltransferase n=1 Tax=hydrothermal vent metagenome TaxID=652676 RepID=A0A3B0TKU7_9ZZZZ
MGFKKHLKSFVKNWPFILKTARNLRDGKLFKKSFSKAIKGKNNTLKIDFSARLMNCKIEITGDANQILIKENTVLNNVNIYIQGSRNRILLSNNVSFNRGGALWIEDEYCELIIGEHTTFEDTHIAVTEPNSKITIGSDCMFANDIDVRTGDSHSIFDAQTNKKINYAQNIAIADHVWVGSHVSILKGSKILSNSIVATRSVVTKKFDQEGVLLAGTPAKIIKDNITWKRERTYENETHFEVTAPIERI